MINPHKLNKLKKIIELSIDPYPTKFEIDSYSAQIISNFSLLSPGEHSNKVFSIAGRIMQNRDMGKVIFMHIQDRYGKIQLYFSEDKIGKESYSYLKLLDIGDFIGVKGNIFKTKRGEISLNVHSYSLLTKSLAQLPEKWHGITDPELKLRKRYLDLIMNRDNFELFKKRTELIKNIRKFLDSHNFIEVETPILEQIPGGADARPFITHHNVLDIDLYLRISLELHLKRLLVAGYEKIYEIGKVFRNEGMSSQHLQEFTLLEFYIAYIDYEQLMDFVEQFYQYIIKETFGTLSINYQGTLLDFSGHWIKLDYTKIVKEKTGIDIMKEDSREKLISAIEKKGLKLEINEKIGRGRIIDMLYKQYVRPYLIQPCFLINHPLDISPLAKKLKNNPNLVQRFQIVAAGIEIGNAFSELNDPIDQRIRFEEQMKLRAQGDEEAQRIDEDFIEALEYGMPPAAGFGVGIDRLFMILSNQPSIRDVVFFPIMKPENK